MKIDFYQPIKNENGDAIETPKRDGEGNIVEDDDGVAQTKEVTIAEHLIDFLEAGFPLIDSRAEFSALQGITSDIEREEKEYTERSVEIILDTVDKVLQNKDGSVGKAPIVMKNVFGFLDDLEEKIEDEDDDS